MRNDRHCNGKPPFLFTVYYKKGGKSIAKTKAEIQRDYAKRTGYAANKKYDATHLKRINLALNIKTDADILKKLSEVPNKQAFIKESIRKNMN